MWVFFFILNWYKNNVEREKERDRETEKERETEKDRERKR